MLVLEGLPESLFDSRLDDLHGRLLRRLPFRARHHKWSHFRYENLWHKKTLCLWQLSPTNHCLSVKVLTLTLTMPTFLTKCFWFYNHHLWYNHHCHHQHYHHYHSYYCHQVQKRMSTPTATTGGKVAVDSAGTSELQICSLQHLTVYLSCWVPGSNYQHADLDGFWDHVVVPVRNFRFTL